jgi:hypothetical protein
LNPRHFHGSAILPLLVWRIVFACLMVCKCDMAGSDEDHGKRRRPGAEDRGWSSTDRVLGGRAIRRSDDVVCDLHRAPGDEEHKFVG